ncbi:hypothetical protein H8Z72_22560 (plasmid) [Xanthomonas citri pv. citri]|uniref:hypothetical protein n=1 Tax=Xanthomonas citri TaxID=346 RepID=UPI0019346696|nr:hypothetical protein [Xanthomonas citri]QRD62687.1 hypothetical protein H8Z74_23625 [Xanthomonas citri pv. citri]QRD67222.1 hypothetical protein H8Z73_22605 [Xanthomonas citri pv. citri]QRD71733.1 hypothetical protein H8Z72_22560 [Xanthomonas citri pv. citri]
MNIRTKFVVAMCIVAMPASFIATVHWLAIGPKQDMVMVSLAALFLGMFLFGCGGIAYLTIQSARLVGVSADEVGQE